ncbi:histidine phosphatase family protein [bacterium]|nr:histidine phosphatase family protein [bacterium]
MKLYLIRHGETDQNKNEVIQGRGDFPLSDIGIKQSIEAGKTLKKLNYHFTKAYSSPLTRAKDTLKNILNEMELNLEIKIENDLIEREFGELEGMKLTPEVRNLVVLDNAKGFEKKKDLFKRVKNVLLKIVKESNKDDEIIIVTHSHVIKPVLMMLDENSFNFNSRLYNLGMVTIEYKDDSFTLIEANRGLANGQSFN